MVEIRECGKNDFDGVLGLLEQLWPDRQLDHRVLRKVYDACLEAGSPRLICAVAGVEVMKST